MNKNQKKPTKLKFHPKEKVEILNVKRTRKGHRYAVTDHGRAIRFHTVPDEGKFMHQFLISAGYPCVYVQDNDKRVNAMVHRLVATYFLPKPRRDQKFVIHIDRDKYNNHVSNLKWANKDEHLAHAMAGEAWQLATKRARNAKLNEGRVRVLKKQIASGKFKMKQLAVKYGITEMQVYRIKSGENWAWVK
jgi:anti-sigma28 factor (negative regulator of flagellin synthesis)